MRHTADPHLVPFGDLIVCDCTCDDCRDDSLGCVCGECCGEQPREAVTHD